MELGMVGLGKMGANMTTRLLERGQKMVVYDRNAEAVQRSAEEGATGAESLGELVRQVESAARHLEHGARRCTHGERDRGTFRHSVQR